MRKVIALGAALLFVGSVSIASAQERGSAAGVSGLGVGTGVGDISGSSSRSQAFDKNAFYERLAQAETVYGRVLAVDLAAGKIFLETGGSSHDEGRAGGGSMNSLIVYLDNHTNMDQIRVINNGDDVTLQVFEETSATHPYGTGRKLVREITVIRGNEKMAGFGGLGQRPNPDSERGINTNSASGTGGEIGKVLPGDVHGGITTTIGDFTGAAPCWQCDPQPGWGHGGSFDPDKKMQNKSDYGVSKPEDKVNLIKQ